MAADSRSTAGGLRFMASGQGDPDPRAGVAKAAGRGGGHPLPGPLARLFRARCGFGRCKEPRGDVAPCGNHKYPFAMAQIINIRLAQDGDADHISALVQHTIRVSNSQDYSAAIIDRVADSFSAEAVLGLIRQRVVFVAVDAENLVGTASLDGEVVRRVFVHPEMQGRGIGHRLMNAIEALANQQGVVALRVPASLTAKPFYARLGYVEIKEVLYGEERTVVMEKCLG